MARGVNRTRLTGMRLANTAEKQMYGAEVIFTREDKAGAQYTIYAVAVDGSYNQWGAHREVLGDNVPTVTRWAKHPDRLDSRYE